MTARRSTTGTELADDERITYGELFRPEVAPSNVENGVGFVAGLTTDREVVDIPFDQQPRTTVP